MFYAVFIVSLDVMGLLVLVLNDSFGMKIVDASFSDVRPELTCNVAWHFDCTVTLPHSSRCSVCEFDVFFCCVCSVTYVMSMLVLVLCESLV